MDDVNNRINLILFNNKFIKYLKRNNKNEKKREFCKHNLEHFIDVARIAYILNIEEGFGFNKDIVYGAALLHDIGKWRQYEEGIPHNESSAVLAKEILAECGYSGEEVDMIVGSILTHRDEVMEDKSLNYLIYYGDKQSRNCFFCKARKECNWEEEKKNKGIVY